MDVCADDGVSESKFEKEPNDESIASVRYRGKSMKDIIAAATSSNDVLWLTVMAHAKTVNPVTQENMWKIIDSDDADDADDAVCTKCRVAGSCVLIRCEHGNRGQSNGEKPCSCKYHLDCAYHDGGLQLDENRLLKQQCNDHYRPPLFCSCKKPYDDSQAMILCDECCDWFHAECEGLSSEMMEKITADGDNYMCRNCRLLIKHGKTISQEVKDRNEQKDMMSEYTRLAQEAVNQMMKVTLHVCPILDELNNAQATRLTLQHIQGAYQFLCSAEFVQKETFSHAEGGAGAAAAADEAATDSEQKEGSVAEDLLAELGVRSLIDRWRAQLFDYIECYNGWAEEAKNSYPSIVADLLISFQATEQQKVETAAAALYGLLNAAIRRLRCTPKDMDGFKIVLESIRWMAEFLQVGILLFCCCFCFCCCCCCYYL